MKYEKVRMMTQSLMRIDSKTKITSDHILGDGGHLIVMLKVVSVSQCGRIGEAAGRG